METSKKLSKQSQLIIKLLGLGNTVAGQEILAGVFLNLIKEGEPTCTETWLGAVASNYSPWLDLATRRGLLPSNVKDEIENVLDLAELTYEDLEWFLQSSLQQS